jgi:hypothetical protein
MTQTGVLPGEVASGSDRMGYLFRQVISTATVEGGVEMNILPLHQI